MSGWKTWVSAALVGVIAVVQSLEAGGIIPAGVGNAVSTVLGAVAAMFGIVGIGHKIDKIGQ